MCALWCFFSHYVDREASDMQQGRFSIPEIFEFCEIVMSFSLRYCFVRQFRQFS